MLAIALRQIYRPGLPDLSRRHPFSDSNPGVKTDTVNDRDGPFVAESGVGEGERTRGVYEEVTYTGLVHFTSVQY